MSPEDLLDRVFRANPRYELVPLDRLSAAERGALAAAPDPDLYGVLRPLGGALLAVRSADRDIALLWLTLREPGPLPSYLRPLLGAAAARTVARLVADGVLEVASGGAFVSGVAALAPPPESAGGGGRLAALSIAALRHAAALAVEDPMALSLRLYGYNRLPLTPRWQRRLPSAEAVEAFLGIGPGGPSLGLLGRCWVPGGRPPGWLSWESRRERSPGGAGNGATWKLYLSPAPEALEEGFGGILEALAAAGAPPFKVGADAWGLLRPDKVVAYFPSFERLAAAAAALDSRLAGLPAHGVPFTAEIGGGGLLSWGADPPPAMRAAPGAGPSWRLWVTHRAARAILDARAAGEAEPWRSALARLRLEGVDVESWAPGALLWQGSA